MPPWLITLRSLVPLFLRASSSRAVLQLMVAPRSHEEHVLLDAQALQLFHGREGVDVLLLYEAPACEEEIAVLHGRRGAVDYFLRLARDAGMHLPADFFPGLPPALSHFAWVSFVLRQLRAHPGRLLLTRCQEAERPYDEVMNDPFLASATAIELAGDGTGAPAGGAGAASGAPMIVWRVGGDDSRAYRVGDGRPVAVSEDEDTVLQAFIGEPAMQTKRLKERSGLDDPAAVIARLRQRYGGTFAEAIACPGGRGGGGYAADVRQAPASN